MKKRILSMLLAIVMVVSALPLLVFTAMAEETDTPEYPETTKEEYNELYEREGLVIQYDFFDSNEHWGGNYSDGTRAAMTDTSMHSSPLGNLRDYFVYSNSKDKSTYTARIGQNGMTGTYSGEAFDYLSASTIGDGFLSVPTITNRKHISVVAGIGSWARPDKVEGDKVTKYDYMMNVDFIDDKQTYTFSQQLIASYQSKAELQGDAGANFRLNNIGIHLAVDENGSFYFQKATDHSGNSGTVLTTFDFGEGMKNYAFAKGKIVDYTHVISQPTGEGDKAEEAQPGTLGVFVDGQRAYYNTNTPFAATAISRAKENRHCIWNGRYSGNIYAIRYYNVVLDEAVIAKNHFADLAKWFRLDLSNYNEYFNLLSDKQKLAAYNRFAEFDFDSDRAAVQAVADVAFEQALYDDEYFAGFSGVLNAHALAVAKQFSIDLSAFEAMPKAYMKKTLAWFASIDLADEKLEKTAVKAAYIRVVEEDVWDYAEDFILTESTAAHALYNSVYEQNGLVIQYDFFDSNEYWGGEHSNVTDEKRLVMQDTNIHSGTETLLPYKQFARGTSANAYRFGLNGLNNYPEVRPTLGNGYLSLPQTTKVSAGNGWGAWGRTSGTSSWRNYMMTKEFIEGATFSSETSPAAGTAIVGGTFTLSAQIVSAYSSFDNTNKGYQFFLGYTRLRAQQDANTGAFYFYSVLDGAGQNPVYFERNEANSFTPGQVVDLTQVLQQTSGEGAAVTVAQPGLYGIYLNGASVYYNKAHNFFYKADARPGNYHLLWNGGYAANAYAVRFYNTVIDKTIIEKNHFADVAKWYKIALVGWDELNDEQKKDFYPLFADITVDDPECTRTEVQMLYIKTYVEVLREAYAPLMEEYAGKDNELSLIKLASDWLLPVDTLTAVLTSDRDMAYVYANVTEETLAAADDAGALLEKAYNDAYKYYSYADGTNVAFLDKAVELSLDVTKLMSLPRADRAPVYGVDLETLSQAAIDAAVKTVKGKYADYAFSSTEADYNALYATDINGDGASDLYYAIDFFHSNEYWQAVADKETYIPFPTHPLLRPEYATEASRGGLVNGVYAINENLSKALEDYRMTVMPNFLDQGKWLGKNSTGVYYGYTTSDYIKNDATLLTYWDPIARAGNGFVQLNKRTNTNSYLNFSGAVGESAAESRTFQFVMSPSDGTQYGKAYWLLVNGISLRIDRVNDETVKLVASSYGGKISGVSCSNTYTLPSNPTFSMTDVATFTMATTIPADFQKVKFSLSYNTSPLVTDVAVNYAYTTVPNQCLLGFSDSSTAGLYAIRFYNGTLDPNEIMQNNFADLAKFYMLNLYGDLFTTEAGKALLTGEGGLYEKFAAYTIGKADRDTLQELINEAVYDLVWKELEKPTDAAYTKLLNAAAKGGVPKVMVEAIATLPPALRNAIMTEINASFGDMSDEGYTYEVVAYYLDSVTDRALDERYAAYEGVGKTYTQEEYNALYARQDHLVAWFDFFSAKKETVADADLVKDFVLTPENAPGVIRVGKLKIGSYTNQGQTYTPAHKYADGFFRMAAYLGDTPGMGLTSIERDEKVSADDYLQNSDYTYEFVAFDMEGGNAQPFQLDGVRMSLEVKNGLLVYGTRAENGFTFGTTTGELAFKTSSHRSFYTDLSSDTVNKGNTIVLRGDKDFTVEPVQYYKLPLVDGEYKVANLVEVSKAEAMATADYTDEALFDAALELPEAGETGWSKVLENKEKTRVYATRSIALLTYDMSLNGVEFASRTAPYSFHTSPGLGSGMNMSFYSIRRYDIVLTDAELMQNHFVDLCKYYGLDISIYLQLDEEGRAAVHEAMKSYLLKDEENKAKMMSAYKNALRAAYYDDLKLAGEEAYNAFIDEASVNLLDLSALLALPKSIRTKIGNANGIAALGVERPAHIALGLYDDILTETVPVADPVYLAKQLIRFSGYSVRVTGSYDKDEEAIAGIRSTFVINQELLAQLVEEGEVSVVFGAIVKNPTSGMSAELVVYDKGQLPTVIPEGKTVEDYTVNGFNFLGNAYERANALGETELCYTYTTLYDAMNGTPWSEIDFALRKAVIEKELAYSYFIELDGVRYEFECESPTFGDTVSSAEVYDYFRSVGEHSADAVVGDIVSTKLGETEAATLYNVTVDGKALADMKIVYGVGFKKEEAMALAKALYNLTGVRVEVIEQGANYCPQQSGALTEEEKAGVIWLTADPWFNVERFGDEYLKEAQFGWFFHGSHEVFTFAVNEGSDRHLFADALCDKIAEMADENGNVNLDSSALVTFGTTAE